MADNDVLINCVNGDSSEFLDIDHSPKNPNSTTIDHLNQRIESLEQEKSNLMEDNSISAQRIVELKAEVDSLRNDGKAVAAIAKRASELEGEVERLREDLNLTMNENEESNREIEDLKAKIKERESEIEKLKREKKVAEDSVGELQSLLNDSKEKVKLMEVKMEQLEQKSKESEVLIGGLMEKIEEKKSESAIVEDVDEQSKGFKGLNSQLPIIGAVSAGAIVAVVAVCYVRGSINR